MKNTEIEAGKVVHFVEVGFDNNEKIQAHVVHLTIESKSIGKKGWVVKCNRKIPIRVAIYYGADHPDNKTVDDYEWSSYMFHPLRLNKGFLTPKAAYRFCDRMNSQNLTEGEKEIAMYRLRKMKRNWNGRR